MKSNGNKKINKVERDTKRYKVEQAFAAVLDGLGFNWREDENMADTPRRVSKMFVDEIFNGTFESEPNITTFQNRKKYDQIIVSGPISIKSMCSHHFMPFEGQAWIGYIPGKKVIGISKLTRIARWFMKRPQIQEELTEQIADYITDKLKPQGVMVIIKCKHYCMIHRGVEENNAIMTTSTVRGLFKEKDSVKREFMELIK